ncbi:Uncharacterised protein [Chlamydia trachomatis]|nr:Uncharacterised protein [Chlamydia trachomatis]CQB88978.1 Uncharacterised protein [Chlamydia trachomatis]
MLESKKYKKPYSDRISKYGFKQIYLIIYFKFYGGVGGTLHAFSFLNKYTFHLNHLI